MSQSRVPYSAAFRQQMIELMRASKMCGLLCVLRPEIGQHSKERLRVW